MATKKKTKTVTASDAKQPKAIVVTHLINADPSLGWLYSIAASIDDAIDAEQDSKQAMALLKQAKRYADKATRAFSKLGVDGTHPIASIIADALAAQQAGWLYEVQQARDKGYFFEASIQRAGGVISGAKRREKRDALLKKLAEQATISPDAGIKSWCSQAKIGYEKARSAHIKSEEVLRLVKRG